MNRWIRTTKTITQLGLRSSIYYGIYQMGLRSGYFRRATPFLFLLPAEKLEKLKIQWPIQPDIQKELRKWLIKHEEAIVCEAKEVINNQVRLFGGPPAKLVLRPEREPHHWTEYELNQSILPRSDIKLIWEPARFGWLLPLIRAFLVTGEFDYVNCFWANLEQFITGNPFNLGVNWTSAQEVALRLIQLSIAGSFFYNERYSSEDQRLLLLSSIYMHARRIVPTLWYARAQNNNHLISEAVGLYTASMVLNGIPEAEQWHQTGWKWFHRAIHDQINEHGLYIQHSMNYHRMMLQLALWMNLLSNQANEPFPEKTRTKLAQATYWYLTYIHPDSGFTPNLGHNDGSNLFAPCQTDYRDHRPTAQAASLAYLKRKAFPSTSWDEMSLWFKLKDKQKSLSITPAPDKLNILRIGSIYSFAYLRAAQFNSRPAHADQLHTDIWFDGYALTLDAGTYLYNSPPDWKNALAGTSVHNTITIDDQDQMVRAGKFLWLDWAQAHQVEEQNPKIKAVTAEHDGYRRLGIIHRRRVQLIEENEWQIEDYLIPTANHTDNHHACLHWLLPDWPWQLIDQSIELKAPFGTYRLTIKIKEGEILTKPEIDLIRAGKSLMLKRRATHISGWYSPTYNLKEPALSLCYQFRFCPPFVLVTQFIIHTN